MDANFAKCGEKNRRQRMKTEMSKLALAGILFTVALLGTASAQREPDTEPTADMNFLILKEDNGKPIRNAAIIMHPVSTNGKQSRGGLELKTDADGKTSFEGVPYGKLRVQVLAPGFQTFGEDYEINQPTVEITIKLKRPEEQYSIYGNQQNDPKDNKPPTPPDPNAKPQP